MIVYGLIWGRLGPNLVCSVCFLYVSPRYFWRKDTVFWQCSILLCGYLLEIVNSAWAFSRALEVWLHVSYYGGVLGNKFWYLGTLSLVDSLSLIEREELVPGSFNSPNLLKGCPTTYSGGMPLGTFVLGLLQNYVMDLQLKLISISSIGQRLFKHCATKCINACDSGAFLWMLGALYA